MAKKIIKKGKALLRDIREGLVFDIAPSRNTSTVEDKGALAVPNVLNGLVGVADSISGKTLREFDGVNDYIEFQPEQLKTQIGTIFEDFETAADWTGSDCTIAEDTTHKVTGNKCIKATIPITKVNGYIERTINKNFANDNEISFIVDIPDISHLASYHMVMYLSEDAGFSKFFSISMQYKLHEGKNKIVFSKSEMSTGNGASWNNNMVRLRWRMYVDGGANVDFYFDSLMLSEKTKPTVIITFDDGWESQHSKGFAYMQKLGLKASTYIIGSKIDTANYLTMSQLQELYDGGWDICNHTYNHVDLTGLADQATIEAEIEDGEDFLTTNGFNRNNSEKHLAYPGGKYNATVLAAVAARNTLTARSIIDRKQSHYLDNSALLTRQGIYNTTTEATAKGYIDKLISSGGALLLNFHIIKDVASVSTECPTAVFNALMEKIASEIAAGNLQNLVLTDWYDKVQNPFGITDKMTVEVMVKPTAAWAASKRILHKYNSAFALVPFEIGADSTGDKFYFGIVTAGGRVTSNTLAGSAAANSWYHVVGVYDGANVKIYLNGVYKGQSAQTGNVLRNWESLLFGKRDSTYWQGILERARIYNRDLSASEIVNNYRQARKRLGFSVMV